MPPSLVLSYKKTQELLRKQDMNNIEKHEAHNIIKIAFNYLSYDHFDKCC